ncbi:Chromosome partition protein Smc [Planococcus massiliensis]|uniref:Chromosome partition protein Smc n=1 Tax=Planococcus massiliensis TaxID=1499687 RepID=A0A098ENT0_9BACL|nr:excalibur calcium-binding domain-containing protein [Planococcus massiliensis]CEG23949.1 Chromosome partition protein Smc [Planococcus massiliensis]
MEFLLVLLVAIAWFTFVGLGIMWFVFKFIKRNRPANKYGRNSLIALLVLILALVGFDASGASERAAELQELKAAKEELTSKNKNLEYEIASLSAKYEESLIKVEEASAEILENENAAKELEEQKTAFAKEKEELTAKITSLEEQVANAESVTVALESEVEDLKSQAKAQSVSVAAAAASSSAGSSNSSSSSGETASAAASPVSYKNCSAVRAAGAAPIYKGDPGYGSHLDRDGDGIGCE